MNKFRIVYTTFSITIFLATVGFAYLYFNHMSEKGTKPPVETVSDSISKENLQEIRGLLKDKANNTLYEGRKTIITETVSDISSAIVGINVTEIRKYRDIWSRDPFFRQFFGDRVYKQEIKGLGSGAIISPDGYIVTNDHVAGNAVEVVVTMTDGTRHKAEIIGSDKASDICLLKIDGENLPYIRFGNSKDILIGEWIIALGNPFGLFAINEKPTVTVGVVSSTGMNLGEVDGRYYINMIQTDAAINTGNSGGPLVNSLGEMIGLNTIIYTAQGSSGSVGVGFSIPIDKVKRIVTELKESGSIDRSFWTGLHIQDINENLARYFNLNKTKGVIITNVSEDSPADKAGLEVGDIIREFDKFRIDDSDMLLGVINDFRPGDEIRLKILRNGEIKTTKIKLERQDD